MTKPTPHEFIESCLDVNASWREAWNDFGCLAAFDYDFELQGTITVDLIMEECGVSEEEAVEAVYTHVRENGYTWTKDVMMMNFDRVIETLDDGGTPASASSLR